MKDCENCIHKKVCELWRSQERQDASCFSLDGCDLFESKCEMNDMKNELCQYCGKYKYAHEGACYGCRWREM